MTAALDQSSVQRVHFNFIRKKEDKHDRRAQISWQAHFCVISCVFLGEITMCAWTSDSGHKQAWQLPDYQLQMQMGETSLLDFSYCLSTCLSHARSHVVCANTCFVCLDRYDSLLGDAENILDSALKCNLLLTYDY